MRRLSHLRELGLLADTSQYFSSHLFRFSFLKYEVAFYSDDSATEDIC